MDPKIWGKSGWVFLFSVALGFPEKPNFQQIDNYKNFFTYLQYVLPCEICRLHYTNHLNQIIIDPYMTGRDNLFLWILKIHNLVNKENGKKSITKQDVMKIYFHNLINGSEKIFPISIWEYNFWKFIFAISYEYPAKTNFQDQSNYKKFFTYIQPILPCENYKKKYYENFILIPIDQYLTTTEDLFNWVLKMHNSINNNMHQLDNESDVLQSYFDYNINKNGELQKNENLINESGLIEGFNETSLQVNLNDKKLLNKNISLGILVLLTSLLIYGSKN